MNLKRWFKNLTRTFKDGHEYQLPVGYIYVPKYISETTPAEAKMQRAREFYVDNDGDYRKPVVVDEDFRLKDGYTSYLVAKENHRHTVRVLLKFSGNDKTFIIERKKERKRIDIMRNKKLAVLGMSLVLGISTFSGRVAAKEVTPSQAERRSIVDAKFFIRIDNVEQKEDGTTHYDSKHYVKFAEGKVEAILTNKNNTEDFEETIRKRIFLPERLETETETAYIKWYVIKVESDGWRVDGIWCDKETGKELPQGLIKLQTPTLDKNYKPYDEPIEPSTEPFAIKGNPEEEFQVEATVAPTSVPTETPVAPKSVPTETPVESTEPTKEPHKKSKPTKSTEKKEVPAEEQSVESTEEIEQTPVEEYVEVPELG